MLARKEATNAQMPQRFVSLF